MCNSRKTKVLSRVAKSPVQTLLSVFIIATFVGSGFACATSISYTVGGWSQQFPGPVTPPANAPWGPNGYPGDTVEFQTYTGMLDLSNPATQILQINELLWTIDYTYAGTATDPNAWSDLQFNFNALRNISFGGVPAGMIGQAGQLDVTWENDYLSLANGGAFVFTNVDGGDGFLYEITVAPLGLDEVGGSNFNGSNPWSQPSRDVMAEFTVVNLGPAPAPVPEPATVTMMGLGLASLAAARKVRSKFAGKK
ncbi:MAG: PEP-CTERM sorting domain-containing protein [Candidatus Hydrogenedentes bacterium]|nr:PEP-CTERM sorting domain-containing protein [Candidatus Hydrogenedentota bacterium]